MEHAGPDARRAKRRGEVGEGRATALRIRVDPGRCEGHGRCKALAPELFVLDGFGSASAAGDGAVPPGLEAGARLAGANCPERAVEISEDAG